MPHERTVSVLDDVFTSRLSGGGVILALAKFPVPTVIDVNKNLERVVFGAQDESFVPGSF